MNHMLSSAPSHRHTSSRGRRLLSLVLAASAVLFVPSVLLSPSRQSASLLLVQVLIAGAVLGVGRQGIDLLGLRLLLASLALPLGWWAGGAASNPPCTGLQSCFQFVTLGLIFMALLVGVVLALVAIPITVFWNKGLITLRPELPWRRLPKPRTSWQWALLAVGVSVGLIGLDLVLGFPAP